MSQKQPSLGITYRIQNVDHGKYLEFPNTQDSEYAEGRDLLPTTKQQWTFEIPDSTFPTTFKIVNAATMEGDIDGHYALSCKLLPSGSFEAISEDTLDTKVVWRIKINETREHCTIVTTKPGQTKPTARLQMNRDKTVELTEDDKVQDNQRWRLIPVSTTTGTGTTGTGTTTLTRNTYRIRDIGGTVALTVHAGTSRLKLDQLEIGPHQAWELIPQGGGDYEIKKVGQDEHLSWQPNASGWYNVSLSLQPTTWTIVKLGIAEYGLRPKIEGQNLALSNAGTTTKIVLRSVVPTARAQTWIIDRYQGFDRNVNPDDDFPRRPEIKDGKYTILHNSTQYFLWVRPGEPEVTGTQISNPLRPHLELRYENNTSKYFTLRSDDMRYVTLIGDHISTGDKGTLWYLFKVGAFYCISPKGSSPRRALGGTYLLNGKYLWRVETYTGQADKMWKITSV